MTQEIKENLRNSYDLHVQEREGRKPWRRQVEEREAFLSRMRLGDQSTLLDAGAATGIDGRFFANNGIDVTCVDLSPENVKAAQEKGLKALEMDITQLDFADGTFDAAWSWNCLLHLPKAEWPAALTEIKRVLKPTGCFFLGVFGGNDFEGVWEDDDYQPQRFYTFMRDADLQSVVAQHFEILDFHTHQTSASAPAVHFQALTCKKSD
ncbi:MAG: class I SAM-dependent methyltransferase [Anaerolineae bacterium]